ncbi:hypothetical protein Leryth_000045 [Lithospermum erythrorhizon]|nr:hypothetical protein Leryth_000045 [Lithospermum erythrorhizon]
MNSLFMHLSIKQQRSKKALKFIQLMEEKNSLHRITILMFFFLLLSCIKKATGAPRCPNCGSTLVPYPLSTGPDCGDQAYKVSCKGGTLYFNALQNASYVITSINSVAQKFTLRPPSLFPNTCLSSDLPSEGIALDQSLPFNITGSNTILLMNCTDNMLHLQVPINCSSTCPCHLYINSVPAAAPCNKIELCCAFRTGGSQNEYIIRVHDHGCLAYQSYVNLDQSQPFSKWPQPGLELMWATPPEPLCNTVNDCRGLLYSRCLTDPQNAGKKRCFCKKGRYWDPGMGECRKCRHGSPSPCKMKSKTIPVVLATMGTLLLVTLSGFLVYFQRVRAKREAVKVLVKEREEILNANKTGKSAKIFSGKDIRKATNNFLKDNLLGSGGFGEVFKGTLDDGSFIAVKRAKPGNTKGTLQVLNEVKILCQVNHRFLVRLLGCCVELEEPLLIYEYVPNGTLFDHLHGFHLHQWDPLNWIRRLTIAYQTAEGLAYLHSSAEPPIYHRDVKSSNILLDEKLDAKVADFGLSRLVELTERDNTHINTSAQGTLGYLDPEYYVNLQLTEKSDVYSFGVVLFELLTSKKAIDFNRDEEHVNLVVYMKRVMNEERLIDVVDDYLMKGASKADIDTMTAMANLAAACLDERRQNRPSMKEVADEIEYIIGIVQGQASK